MVAQTEQAVLAIARGNAAKETTVKILECTDMEPRFVKVEMMRRNRPTQQNFTRSRTCVYFWFRVRVT